VIITKLGSSPANMFKNETEGTQVRCTIDKCVLNIHTQL